MQVRLILLQCGTKMFSLKWNCRTLAEFDLTDRLPSVSGREQNPPKILGGKLSTMGLEKSKSGRVRKKGMRVTCPFVNTAPVLFLSSVPPRLSSLARIVTHSHPLSTYFLQSQHYPSFFRPHSLFREYFFPI